jgi:hypothetical protein
MRPRYAALSDFFSACFEGSVQLPFSQIERIIGGSLPPSARRHRSYWGNDESHSHARAWLSNGYRASVSMADESATFELSTQVMAMNSYNTASAAVAALGVSTHPRLSVRSFSRRRSTCEDDREAFETVRDALMLAAPDKLTIVARVHDGHSRGRRREPGYGTIAVLELGTPARDWLGLVFADGSVYAARSVNDGFSGAVSEWPRMEAAMQFLDEWRLDNHFMLPELDHSPDGSPHVVLRGVIRLSKHAGRRHCLRLALWLCRESRTFETRLRQVLTRKRGLSPARATALARSYLRRYARPRPSVASPTSASTSDRDAHTGV